MYDMIDNSAVNCYNYYSSNCKKCYIALFLILLRVLSKEMQNIETNILMTIRPLCGLGGLPDRQEILA